MLCRADSVGVFQVESRAQMSMLQRLSSAQKALVIAGLAAGFGRGMRRAGFTTNAGFAGVSAFDVAVPFADELAEFFRAPGRRHLVMCHPGYPDADLARLDPHTQRRRQELDAIMAEPRLDATIWHVQRSGDAETPVWPGSVQDRVVAARQDRPA